MLLKLAIRFLCLCLALTVAVQLAVPMAGAADLPCHAPDMAVASGDMPAPCSAGDPVCPGKGCLGLAFALPVPGPQVPAALDLSARAAGSDMPLLRPLQVAGGLLRPPKA